VDPLNPMLYHDETMCSDGFPYYYALGISCFSSTDAVTGSQAIMRAACHAIYMMAEEKYM
jgi:hypothetical protein